MKLMDHQRLGVEVAMNRRGTGLFFEQGCGKTASAIWASFSWLSSNPAWKSCLVIVPASLRINWQLEIEAWMKHYPIRGEWTVGVFSQAYSFPDTNFVIVSYDMIHRPGVTEYVHRPEAWDIAILDEAQYIQNLKSIRARHILGESKDEKITIPKSDGADKLDSHIKDGWTVASETTSAWKLHRDKILYPAVRARRKLALTGTPMMNKVINIFGILKWLEPDEWDYWPFAIRYCGGKRGYNNRIEVNGSSNLDELNRRLTQGKHPLMVRVLKKDVLKDLPEKMHKIVTLPPPESVLQMIDQEKKIYTLHENILRDLRKARSDASVEKTPEYRERVMLLRQQRSSLFGQMATIRKRLAMTKAPLAVAHVKEMLDSGTHKIIVFGTHREPLSIVADSLSSYGSQLLLGGTDAIKRHEMVVKFQTDPSMRVFVLSSKAGGTGLTLHASHNVVIFEAEWTDAATQQSTDRAHRYGQTKGVVCEYLVFEESLDVRLLQVSINKASIAEQAIDGTSSTHQPTSTPKDQASAARKLEYQRRGAEMTEEQKQAAHDAIRKLASLDEQARAKHDGGGFSELHRDIGMKLACRIALTPAQAALAREIATKYKTQLTPSLRIALQS
jgi:SNF2 family DNA or RNA helicase